MSSFQRGQYEKGEKKSNLTAEKAHTHCLKPGDQDEQTQEMRHVDSTYLGFDVLRMALCLCDLLPHKA